MDLKKYTDLARKALKLRPCGAVIVAAGSASRMGGIDKVMAPLRGEPMIVHTARAFQNCEAIREIVIVTREDLIAPIMELCQGFDKVKAVVLGGASRQESVGNGLSMLSGEMELAAIQDGARPLITDAVIDRVVRAASSISPESILRPFPTLSCRLAPPRTTALTLSKSLHSSIMGAIRSSRVTMTISRMASQFWKALAVWTIMGSP